MIGQDPADSSNPCRCSDDAVQSNLAHLHKTNGSGGRIDDEVIEDVLVSIYK